MCLGKLPAPLLIIGLKLKATLFHLLTASLCSHVGGNSMLALPDADNADGVSNLLSHLGDDSEK